MNSLEKWEEMYEDYLYYCKMMLVHPRQRWEDWLEDYEALKDAYERLL